MAKWQPKFVGPYCVIEVMSTHMYRAECSGQVSVQKKPRLNPYWVSPDAAGQAPPLLDPARRSPISKWGMAYTELEEALPNQEGAADVPTDQPRLPPPPGGGGWHAEKLVWAGPTTSGLADTPVLSDKIETPQIHEEDEAVRREPPVQVDPRSGDTTHSFRVTSGSRPP